MKQTTRKRPCRKRQYISISFLRTLINSFQLTKLLLPLRVLSTILLLYSLFCIVAYRSRFTASFTFLSSFCHILAALLVLFSKSFKFFSRLYATIISLFCIIWQLPRIWACFWIMILIFGLRWLYLLQKTILLLLSMFFLFLMRDFCCDILIRHWRIFQHSYVYALYLLNKPYIPFIYYYTPPQLNKFCVILKQLLSVFLKQGKWWQESSWRYRWL